MTLDILAAGYLGKMSGLSRLRLVARALATTARVPIRRASTNSEGFWWERIVDHHHKWENAA